MKWIATSLSAPWCEKAPQPTEASPQLFVTDRRQQTIDGFGGCFNEIGWQVLQALSEDLRAHVLRDLFDPDTGCGYRLCRVPIGANDYALEWYSHNEYDGDLAMDHGVGMRWHSKHPTDRPWWSVRIPSGNTLKSLRMWRAIVSYCV